MKEVPIEQKVQRLQEFFKLPKQACAEVLEKVPAPLRAAHHDILVAVSPEAALRKSKDTYGETVAALVNKIAGHARVVNGLNGQTARVLRTSSAACAATNTHIHAEPFIFYPVRHVEVSYCVRRATVPTNSFIFGVWELLCESIANPDSMEGLVFLADGDQVLHRGYLCVPAVSRQGDRLVIRPIPDVERPQPEYRSILGAQLP